VKSGQTKKLLNPEFVVLLDQQLACVRILNAGPAITFLSNWFY